MPSATPAPDAGERLSAHERRLRLLLAHLSGRAVRARVDLEDLLQEVYLRVWSDARGLPPWEEGEGPLWGILAQRARHVVVDVARALRTKKRDGEVRLLERSDWSRTPGAHGPGPATAAAAAEESRELARRFLELAPEHRRVIGLRQFEGLSAREAAVRLGRSETAVHSLYRRALAAWEAGPDSPGARDHRQARSRDESGAERRPAPP